MRELPPSAQGAGAAAGSGSDGRAAIDSRHPSSPRAPSTPSTLSGQAWPPGAAPASLESWATGDRSERCQGRCLDERGDRVRRCARRPTLRVTGAARATADLCTQHARIAIDRPRLVQDWLHQEGAERTRPGRASPTPGTPMGDGPPTIAHGADPAELAATDLVLRVTAELASVTVVRTALARALAHQGWADELHPLVLLAVGEALNNAIEHGSPAGGAIEVGLTVTPEWAAIRVSDQGRLGASLPLGAPVPPCPTSARGRGRLLMGGIAERVEVRSDGRGTSVLLRFSGPGATARDNGGPG